MKVRINIEKNMSMGLEIPEGTEFRRMMRKKHPLKPLRGGDEKED